MAVFRVEKTKNYVVMATYHVRDNSLSLKSAGLMTKMLSLPDSWDYSIRGLATLCKDGVESISGALKELEAAGYIVRNKIRDGKGRICDTEYIIYEMPNRPPDGQGPSPEKPRVKRANPNTTDARNLFVDAAIQDDRQTNDAGLSAPQSVGVTMDGSDNVPTVAGNIVAGDGVVDSVGAPGKKTTYMRFTALPGYCSPPPGIEPETDELYPACPHTGNPYMDEPEAEPPHAEKHAQLSIKESSINELNNNALNIHQSIRNRPDDIGAAASGTSGIADKMDGMDESVSYRRFVQDNIGYGNLINHYPRERVDETVDIILDSVLSKRRHIRVAGDDKPANVVKSALLKLNQQHIEYVFECMDANTAKIANIKAYLLTALYNAPSTMDSYYAARFNHDMNAQDPRADNRPQKTDKYSDIFDDSDYS